MEKLRMMNFNKIFYIICGFIIIFNSILLSIEYNEKLTFIPADRAGKVIFMNKIAQRKYHSDVIWEKIDNRTPIFIGDTVRTGEKSSAVVNLTDGTDVYMAENSMIQFLVSDEILNVDFSKGSVYFKRGKSDKNKIKKIIIKYNDKKISIDDSDIEIDKKQNGINILTNRGSANIESGDDKYVTKSDSITLLPEKKGQIKDQKIDTRLISPDISEFFKIHSDLKKVTFKWNSKSALNMLLVSTYENFDEIHTKKILKTNNFSIDLSPGRYFWTVYSFNKNTKKYQKSSFRSFRIFKYSPVNIISPANGETFSYRDKLPVIDFLWGKNSYSTGYILEISKDRGFKEITKTIQTQDNSISIDSLDTGDYYFRIMYKTGFDNDIDTENNIYSFSIKKTDKFKKIFLLKPIEKKTFLKNSHKEESIIFSCNEYSEIDNFNLIISKDRDFKDVKFRKKSKNNFITMDNVIEEGHYFWKIEGLIKNESAVTSETRSFQVIAGINLKLNSPANSEIKFIEESQDVTKVKFSWKSNFTNGRYLLKLSNTDKFNPYRKNKLVTEKSIIIDELKSGTYTWNVFLVGNKRRDKLSKSSLFKFTIKESLLPPVIKNPGKDITVNIIKNKDITFNWDRTKGANLYRISFHRLQDDDEALLLTRDIKENQLVLDNISNYGKGKYTLNLQALEVDDSNKMIIQKSRISKRNIIFSREQLGKPRIEKLEIK